MTESGLLGALGELDEQGVLVLRGALDPCFVAQLAQNWRATKASLESGGSIQASRSARFVTGSFPEPLGTLYRHERLVKIAQVVLERSDIALYMQRLLVKDDKWTGAILPHQDAPYFHGGLRKLSVFVPLEAQGPAEGGLQYLAGSHKLGFIGIRGNIRRDRFSFPAVAPELEPGDVVLMDWLTWHFSESQAKPCSRPLVQIVYQPATDGSSYEKTPALACGEWRTKHFLSFLEFKANAITPEASYG